MSTLLTWVAWICLIGSILLPALIPNKEENKNTVAFLFIGLLLTFFILGLFVIPAAEAAETDANVTQCLRDKFGANASVILGDPICIASSRGGCRTWEATYRSGEDSGTIKYSIDSCIISP